MENSHFKILSFLKNQSEPVREDRFPNIITSEYSHSTTDTEGLIHDLRINLSNTKSWINITKYHPNFYVISDFGRAALQKEIDKRFIESEKEELQTRKLKVDLKNAERVLKSYKLTRIFAWVGAISGTIALLLKLIELLGILPTKK